MSEYVYLGHDNQIRLILKQNSVASDLASVTKINVVIGTVTVSSVNGASDPIRWAQAGYATGEVRMTLGAQALRAGTYRHCPIVVFDAVNTNGIAWGEDGLDITVYGRKGGGPFIP
jgi:hypothetical protein